MQSLRQFGVVLLRRQQSHRKRSPVRQTGPGICRFGKQAALSGPKAKMTKTTAEMKQVEGDNILALLHKAAS